MSSNATSINKQDGTGEKVSGMEELLICLFIVADYGVSIVYFIVYFCIVYFSALTFNIDLSLLIFENFHLYL